MKHIWLITRKDNWGYDEYDSIVVVAKTKKDALAISPSDIWPNQKFLNIKRIGWASARQKVGIVLSSFNAG